MSLKYNVNLCSSVFRASIIIMVCHSDGQPGESEAQCKCSSVVRASKYIYTVPEVVGCEL